LTDYFVLYRREFPPEHVSEGVQPDLDLLAQSEKLLDFAFNCGALFSPRDEPLLKLGAKLCFRLLSALLRLAMQAQPLRRNTPFDLGLKADESCRDDLPRVLLRVSGADISDRKVAYSVPRR
jgi:hypothetical protein